MKWLNSRKIRKDIKSNNRCKNLKNNNNIEVINEIQNKNKDKSVVILVKTQNLQCN